FLALGRGRAAFKSDQNMFRFYLLIFFLVFVVGLLEIGVADRDSAIEALELFLRDQVLAKQRELLLDVGVLIEPILQSFGGQKLHAEVVVRELLLARSEGVGLIFGGKRFHSRLEVRLVNRYRSRGDDHWIGIGRGHSGSRRRCRWGRGRRRRFVLRQRDERERKCADSDDYFLHTFSLWLPYEMRAVHRGICGL